MSMAFDHVNDTIAARPDEKARLNCACIAS